MLNFEYAELIARDWNTKDAASGFVGYVTAFDVRDAFLEQFHVQKVGARNHLEYWIPAERLEEFNSNIVGPIRVLATYSKSGH